MSVAKTSFAVFFGNRGFFPGSLMKGARQELVEVLHRLGHKTIVMDEKATRYGAVETVQEGKLYADFLRKNRGKFGGIILSLPNFGDETGAVAALEEAGVPILVQAYPDELDKMAPAVRRDAFCGKFSVMDVFCQYGVKFTALKPHTVSPSSAEFAGNVDYFDRMCRVVNGVKGMTLGAVGARTTPFKTVRCDELSLQKHGITVETYDLSDVFRRMDSVKPTGGDFKAKARCLKAYSNWCGVPGKAFARIVQLGVVLDAMVKDYNLDAIALRCWVEMQQQLNISPCVLLSEMNERGIVVACEVDVGNAVAMHALKLATGNPATCLDWNNNYADDPDKCILFHCGPVPQSLMTAKGTITDHAILANAVGEGCAFGCNTGRIAPVDFTYGSLLTEDGKLKFYVGEGAFTSDPIPEDFFGCAGVAEIEDLQTVLQTIGYRGYRHHVSVAAGQVAEPVQEALTKYLGCEVLRL
ncbi:MAG: hypothetical protein A2498_04845 [Lentisphaerae bacterium RIFOXYC12_FULL_60_16]|nr:MAG: hypothetical protein A2498_04845 [Lentisphaerae bacterium RIFOXYC12_FULL_60_16]